MIGEIICFTDGKGTVWKGTVLDKYIINGNSKYLVKCDGDIRHTTPENVLTFGIADSLEYYERYLVRKNNPDKRFYN